MNLKLSGRSALVCGASQGLGFAIAEALAIEGCRVGLLARSAAKLNARVADFTDRGLAAVALAADMGDWPSVEAALERFGWPEIVVTNTGGPPPVPVTPIDADLWRQQFETMVVNQMRLVSAVIPAMRKEKFGRIINIASTSVPEPMAALPLSGALRSALVNWLKVLAGEVGRDGITVNSLITGSIATERLTKLNEAEAEQRGISVQQVESEAAAAIPVGRFGEPREFAAVATFLASPLASYVTGSTIRVDGGAMHSP